MVDKTQKEQIRELWQAVVGIEENEDENGLIGDFKELVKEFKKMNGRVSRNSRLIFIFIGIFLTLGTLGGLELADIIQLIGG